MTSENLKTHFSEIASINKYLKKNISSVIDNPDEELKLNPIPLEQRKELLSLIVEKQKRLIELLEIVCTGSNESLTKIEIEKGALKVIENFSEYLNTNNTELVGQTTHPLPITG